MIFVSSALKRIVYPILAGSGYLRGWRQKQTGQLTVLAYHGVFPKGYTPRSHLLDGNLIPAKRLRDQLNLLQRHYCVLTPEEFLGFLAGRFELPPRAALLTCDDGLANVVSDMLPVLDSLGLKCIFFVTGASCSQDPGMLWYEELWLLLDKANPGILQFERAGILVPAIPEEEKVRHRLWWKLVKQLSRLGSADRKEFLQTLSAAAKLPNDWLAKLLGDAVQRRRFQLLDRAGVEVLLRSGMTIGAHTMSHPVLSECSGQMAAEEIGLPLKVLPPEWNIKTLAYPFGTHEAVGNREFLHAEMAGYQCAFKNVGGAFSPSIARFAIPRIHITDSFGMAEFEAHASGFHAHFQQKWRHPASFNLPHAALQEP